MQALPVGRQACYGVDISADDITKTDGGRCGPSLSIAAGYVEPGGNLQASVRYGVNRRVDLYLYLIKAGDKCPNLGQTIGRDQLNQTYLVGTAAGVDTTQPTTEVTVEASFPGEATNLAQQLKLPADCAVSPAQVPSPFTLNSGAGEASGNGVVLKARLGFRPRTVLTGAGIRLIVK